MGAASTVHNKKTTQPSSTDSHSEPAIPSTSSVAISSDEASASIKGPASTSIAAGSSFEINCSSCSTGNDLKQAVGYCKDCEEYYCSSCYLGHSTNTSTKYHNLLDQHNMPTILIHPVPSNVTAINLLKGSESDDSQFRDDFYFTCDINIKHPDEAKDCYISGITTLSDSELVLIDQDNKSVKLLDVDKNIINHILYFDTLPCSITTLPHREVAVSFAEEGLIRILSTTGGLSVKKSIKLSGFCVAVQYFNDKLYVSYAKPVKFQILSLSGGVKKTIQPDAQVLHLCTVPAYIAIHPDESKMYVSDCENDVVLCMDMSGAMLAVYKDVGLEEPHAIFFTPSGALYVCNRDQDIIYHMTADLTEAMVVLGEQDGLNYPTAICFSPGRQSLYISSASDSPKICNVIKQYKYS